MTEITTITTMRMALEMKPVGRGINPPETVVAISEAARGIRNATSRMISVRNRLSDQRWSISTAVLVDESPTDSVFTLDIVYLMELLSWVSIGTFDARTKLDDFDETSTKEAFEVATYNFSWLAVLALSP
jgi:hypothetical protein